MSTIPRNKFLQIPAWERFLQRRFADDPGMLTRAQRIYSPVVARIASAASRRPHDQDLREHALLDFAAVASKVNAFREIHGRALRIFGPDVAVYAGPDIRLLPAGDEMPSVPDFIIGRFDGQRFSLHADVQVTTDINLKRPRSKLNARAAFWGAPSQKGALWIGGERYAADFGGNRWYGRWIYHWRTDFRVNRRSGRDPWKGAFHYATAAGSIRQMDRLADHLMEFVQAAAL